MFRLSGKEINFASIFLERRYFIWLGFRELLSAFISFSVYRNEDALFDETNSINLENRD